MSRVRCLLVHALPRMVPAEGYGVWGAGFVSMQGLEAMDQYFGLRVYGLGFKVWSLEVGVLLRPVLIMFRPARLRALLRV